MEEMVGREVMAERVDLGAGEETAELWLCFRVLRCCPFSWKRDRYPLKRKPREVKADRADQEVTPE